MTLNELVHDKGGVIQQREQGECPSCHIKGEQLTSVEFRCVTDKCKTLTWFDWK